MPQFPAMQGFDVSEGLLARAAQSAAMPDRKQSPMQGFLAAKAAKKEEELKQAQFAEQQRQFGVTSDRADKQFNLTREQLENTITSQTISKSIPSHKGTRECIVNGVTIKGNSDADLQFKILDELINNQNIDAMSISKELYPKENKTYVNGGQVLFQEYQGNGRYDDKIKWVTKDWCTICNGAGNLEKLFNLKIAKITPIISE